MSDLYVRDAVCIRTDNNLLQDNCRGSRDTADEGTEPVNLQKLRLCTATTALHCTEYCLRDATANP